MSLIYDRRPQLESDSWDDGFLFRRFGDLVRSFEHPWTTERTRLNEYAATSRTRAASNLDTVAFVDGSHSPVARPTRRGAGIVVSNSAIALKHSCYRYPNGLMTSFGPFDGTTRQHCSTVNYITGWASYQELYLRQSFRHFGDSGYAVTSTLSPHQAGAGQSGDEAEWNREMSALEFLLNGESAT